MCKEKKLQPAQSINKSHLSVVTVLPVDLLQRDSLAVEVRIKGAATDSIFEGLKKQGIFTAKVLLQMRFYSEIDVFRRRPFSYLLS